MPQQGDVVLAKYRLGRQLGKGGFGVVHSATDANGRQYAVKLESNRRSHNYLHIEREVYVTLRALEGKPLTGVPRVYARGSHGRYTALVLDRLGASLDTRLSQAAALSLKTCLIIGVQSIRRIEAVHHAGWLHRDVKPANMLTGFRGGDLRTVYLVDFGAAKRWREPRSRAHIARREGVRFIGTARYASVRTQQGVEASRRDDLESLGYSLLQMIGGELPWQGLKIRDSRKKHEAVIARKKATPLTELCRKLPGALEYMTYVKALGFDQAPDYKRLRNYFRIAMKRHAIVDDGMFDWLEKV